MLMASAYGSANTNGSNRCIHYAACVGARTWIHASRATAVRSDDARTRSCSPAAIVSLATFAGVAGAAPLFTAPFLVYRMDHRLTASPSPISTATAAAT